MSQSDTAQSLKSEESVVVWRAVRTRDGDSSDSLTHSLTQPHSLTHSLTCMLLVRDGYVHATGASYMCKLDAVPKAADTCPLAPLEVRPIRAGRTLAIARTALSSATERYAESASPNCGKRPERHRE